MYETSEYGTCQMDRAAFKRLTSHLKQEDTADSIEADIMEEDLDVCKW